MSTTGPAEIFDLGYQDYAGERTGRWRRRRALWRDGVRSALGLGRGAGAKVAPWLLIGLALVPMAVLVVLAAFLGSVASDPDDFELPSYAEYYEFAIVPLALLGAIVGPQLLCPDRRERVLALYATRPISALDYLGARWTAFCTVAVAVAWLPEGVLWTWNLLDARDTGTFLGDSWDIVPRFLLAGLVLALPLGTLALLVSSFTTRRAYAAIATLAVLFVGAAIGGIGRDNFEGGLADVLSLADVLQAIVDAVAWIFGEEVGGPISGGVSALWVAGLTVVLGAWLLRRTKRMFVG
jgi:ABC-2 type transport system permease protein